MTSVRPHRTPLTDAEIAPLLVQLRDPACPDRAGVITRLQHGYACGCVSDILEILDGERHPLAARAALMYLRFCGRPPDYRGWVERFLAGVPWDRGEELMAGAVGRAETVLTEDGDAAPVARLLVGLARGGAYSQLTREFAVESLRTVLEQLGTPPWPEGDDHPRSPRAAEVVRRAEQRWGATPTIPPDELEALLDRVGDRAGAGRAAAIDSLREGYVLGYDADVLAVLDQSADPPARAAALRYLSACGDPVRYRDLAEHLVGGAAWDVDERVRLAALDLAARILVEDHRRSDPLAVALVDLGRDESVDVRVREVAVAGLRRGLEAEGHWSWPAGDDTPGTARWEEVLVRAEGRWGSRAR